MAVVYISLRNPTLNVNLITVNNIIATPSIRIHDIFSFIIPALLTLVQMRYPEADLFQTHPVTLNLLLFCLLAYSLASGVRLRFLIAYAPWFHTGMLLFGSLSVASLLLLLFPRATWQPVLWVLIIAGRVLLGLVLRFWDWVRRLLGNFRALQSRRRTTSSVLPLTLMELESTELSLSSVGMNFP